MLNAKTVGLYLLLISSIFGINIPHLEAQSNNGEYRVDTSYNAILEPYKIPGIDVSITPPAFFKPFTKGDQFGFIHQGAASTIQIQVIPETPYTFIVEGLTTEELAKQGATLILKEEVITNDEKPAILMIILFTIKKPGQDDAVFERMMLFTGDHTRAIWVNANYPVIAHQVLYNVLRESLLTVSF